MGSACSSAAPQPHLRQSGQSYALKCSRSPPELASLGCMHFDTGEIGDQQDFLHRAAELTLNGLVCPRGFDFRKRKPNFVRGHKSLGLPGRGSWQRTPSGTSHNDPAEVTLRRSRRLLRFALWKTDPRPVNGGQLSLMTRELCECHHHNRLSVQASSFVRAARLSSRNLLLSSNSLHQSSSG